MSGTRIGFIGLGNMGEGMAYNLATKGFALTVFDLRPEPLALLEQAGASLAATCAEVGERSDILCVAVFDDRQIDQVLFGTGGEAGALAGMAPGGLIVLHPTTAPSVVTRIASAAAKQDIAVIDAPMTGGGGVAARAGGLIFMVGGAERDVERARPVLEAMSTTIFHVGPLGAGAAAKIINNFLGVSQTILLREGLRLAAGAGIAEDAMLQILNYRDVAAGLSWSSRNWKNIQKQESVYTSGRRGMVAMARKDMELAHKMAHAGGVPVPTLDALITASLPDLDRSGLTDNGID